ncbi:MAG: ATP-binding protein [Chloroflexi bacterium]|nr:ATP-binding protein [Chloroflexota bacterium]
MSENKITIRCGRNNLRRLRLFVADNAEKCGLDQSAIHDLSVVAEEIGYNIMKYGEMGESGEFDVEVSCEGGRFSMIFRDTGIPFDPTGYKGGLTFDSEGNLEEGGLGLMLVDKLVDEWTYERHPDGINILKLYKVKGGITDEN